ncbi:hypothetical protein AAY473_037285 [Plecturocebus cupreus]
MPPPSPDGWPKLGFLTGSFTTLLFRERGDQLAAVTRDEDLAMLSRLVLNSLSSSYSLSHLAESQHAGLQA